MLRRIYSLTQVKDQQEGRFTQKASESEALMHPLNPGKELTRLRKSIKVILGTVASKLTWNV